MIGLQGCSRLAPPIRPPRIATSQQGQESKILPLGSVRLTGLLLA